MLQIALIGGNSALKIRDLVGKNFDYVHISVFTSISEFSSSVESRSIVVDRLVLLQDALPEDITEQSLHSFDTFLSKHYPSVRFISIMNNRASAMLMSSVFISPFTIHMLMNRMKPQVLHDLVSDNPNILKEKYGFKLDRDTSDEIISEVIDSTDSFEGTVNSPQESTVSPPTITPGSNLTEITPETSKKGKKTKHGLFSMFGKKEKKSKKGKGVSPEVSKTYTPYDTGADPVVQDNFEDNSNYEAPEDKSTDVDFSMFGDDNQVGIGADVNKDYPSSPPETNPFEVEDTSEVPDLSVFDTEGPTIPQLEDSSDVDTFEEQEELVSNHLSTGLDLDDIGGESDLLEEVDTPSKSTVNTEELNSRLLELSKSVFSKEISLDISDIKSGVNNDVSINVTDVEEGTPLFSDDVDKLSEQYESENVRVIEKTVERVIQVNAGKKHYRNGIRILIVTGDRKTGVTHTALNLASMYGKSSRTLYVDMDLARRGSLLYLGLENVAEEEERVRNGLTALNSVNTLEHITYYFTKGGFDCLTTLFGVDIDKSRLSAIQHILQSQRTYGTIIVDCPLENLHLLKDMIMYSEVLFCVESSMSGVLNTILGVNEVFDNYESSSFLYNNGQYFLSKDNDVNLFRENLEYVADSFSLEEEDINWGTMRFLGTCADFTSVVAQL